MSYKMRSSETRESNVTFPEYSVANTHIHTYIKQKSGTFKITSENSFESCFIPRSTRSQQVLILRRDILCMVLISCP